MTLLHLARHSDHLQAKCVRCFQPSHSLLLCSWLVCCLANFCIPCAVAVLLCLRMSAFFFFFFFFFCKECHVLQETALGRNARHAKPR